MPGSMQFITGVYLLIGLTGFGLTCFGLTGSNVFGNVALHGQGTGNASVSDVVTDAASSKGLAGALLILHLDGPGDLAATAVTDDEGRFSFDNLPGGQYTLEAQRTGFDSRWFGACPGEQQGPAVELKPGQKLAGLSIALQPLAAVTGTVTGPDGEPLSRALVSVYSAFSRPGQMVPKRLQSLSASTDARGRFRVFGIPAGTYVVSAVSAETTFLPGSPEAGQQDPQSARYEPVYYPGTPLRENASAVKLTPGETLDNINFQLAVVRAARIELTVEPPPDVDGPLDFEADLHSAFEQSLMAFGFGTPGNTRDPVSFDNVFPGTCNLRLFGKKDGRSYGALERLEVNGNDPVRKQTVRLRLPVTIQGSIHIDSLPADPKCCRIALAPRGADIDPACASIAADGSFTLSKVVPGVWDVNMESIPAGSYVESVRVAGKDVFDEPLMINGSATGSLDVEISSKAAQISGSVTNARSGKVLLAPARDVEKQYLYRTVAVDADGRFQMKDVTPGNYNLFAFRTLEDNVWLDPDFRARIAKSAVKLALKPGAKIEIALAAFDSKNCAE